MKKVDFRKITLRDIEGKEVPVDISKQLGNQLYMQGKDIEECELGRDIYHNGEVELNEKQMEAVKCFVQGYSYVLRQAIESAMNI